MHPLLSKLQNYNWQKLVGKYSSPLVLVDAEIIRKRIQILKSNFPNCHFYYALKANFNPHIVKIIVNEGFGIDAVSPNEVELGLKLGIPAEKIVYNENNMTDDDMNYSVSKKINLTVGSLSRLEKYSQKYPNTEIGIRINGDIGAALHQKTYTAGPKSKFGIHYKHLEKALEIAKKNNVKITTAHQHIGSGWLNSEPFFEAVDILLAQAKKMPDVRKIDFGGGFGIPYKPNQSHIDYKILGQKFQEKIVNFTKKTGRNFKIAFEPGRFIVAESSVLLATVNTRKKNPDGKIFLGTDTGFNHLVRPAMYDSYHQILNLSRLKNPKEKVNICGNLCESSDFFAKDREIEKAEEGDILAIFDVGAYGLAQGSHYNLRGYPAEVLIDGNTEKIIRKRENFEDLMKTFDYPF